jgi:pilus assembly protein CpaB
VRKYLVVFMIVIAIVSGTAAGIMTYRAIKARPAGQQVVEKSKPISIRPLVVATTRIAYGTVLQGEHVRTINWGSDARPDGSFTDVQAVIGRAIIEDLVPNEPVLADRLAPIDAAGGLSAIIPKGKRAISVRVNEVIGVAGFVLPRTRVDVLVSVNLGGDKRKSASRMILQNVQVLAAGQTIERDAEGEPQTVNVITLLVAPDEAERLTLASNEGDIQLALRNGLDLEDVETSGANLGSMVVVSKRRTTRRARPRAPKQSALVEVIKGTKRTTESF